ncbi:unnamed protein product [Cuscuta europaea]|uniref:C2 domain-containing protein n=1 Tax=Cuscuta europaea TaxID=41803 RepID=A0A9P0ZXX6_CUSEU|nr:unnamed protein product [Cuscuta europaea]
MILEIKVISAHALPPISRMLRTYAVAVMGHDTISKTAVDHHGGTNPTWNHKFAIHVDDKFLGSKSSEIKFEIYNVAWLRDLPMGTASLVVNGVYPPLSVKNPAMRPLTLRLCRPTGHLHGILNVGVRLKDNNDPRSEPTAGCVNRNEPVLDGYGNQNDKNDASSVSPNTQMTNRPPSVCYSRILRPLTSSFAAGDFFGGDGDDYHAAGSSIFEGRIIPATAPGETKDEFSPVTEDDDNGSCRLIGSSRRNNNKNLYRRSHSSSDGTGLFSCSCIKLRFV